MTIGATLNRRITQLAVGRHLPHRTVRVRLTLLYGGLFLVSGAALMAITYALLVNAGFVFTIGNGASAVAARLHGGRSEPSSAFPGPGSTTHPSAQTMAHWRGVAQCMRDHGISGSPTLRPRSRCNFRFVGEVSDRDGAVLAIPSTSLQSPAFTQAAGACGFDRPGVLTPQDVQRRTHVRQQLLIQSGIALAAMSLLSLGLGWLMAGRVLQPLEDSYRAQRQFVANASHELRAPLTRQRALIEVALASPEADFASLRKAHERVLASEQHLEQLIDALLALSRGQAGLERRERLDLAALTSEAMLAHDSELADLDLDVRATLDPAPTPGDPRLLERLITNLIDNAIRHNTLRRLRRDHHRDPRPARVLVDRELRPGGPARRDRPPLPTLRTTRRRPYAAQQWPRHWALDRPGDRQGARRRAERARTTGGRTHDRGLIPGGERRSAPAEARHRPL